VNQRFGETYCLHLQGRKIRERGTGINKFPQDLQGDTFQNTAFFKKTFSVHLDGFATRSLSSTGENKIASN
jgi:hypothetical protein